MKRLACFCNYNFLLNGQIHTKMIFSWYMQTANPTLFVVHFGNNRYTKAFANNNCYNYQINFKFLSRFFLPRVCLNNSFMLFTNIFLDVSYNISKLKYIVYDSNECFKFEYVILLFRFSKSLNMKQVSLHICQCYISWLTKCKLASPFKNNQPCK